MRSVRSTSSARGTAFARYGTRWGGTAFGVNAIVYPPGYEGFNHYHDVQDELYFVHAGTARVELGGEERTIGPGGSFTSNRGRHAGCLTRAIRTDLILLVVGAKNGYVARD